ncbi:unnamed protein product [Boreogadus saida]
MLKGVPAVPHLDSLIPRLTCLCLLAHLCLGARVPGATREESGLVNPLGAGEEERRLLQSYIQAHLKEGEGSDVSTWEQAVFFLFHLYDFDRSGHIDGLEMMKLLSDYNSHAPLEASSNESIITMVDFLLKTRDLNQDGLLGPSELLSSPLPYIQDSDDEALQQGEVAVEEKLVAPEDSLKAGEEMDGKIPIYSCVFSNSSSHSMCLLLAGGVKLDSSYKDSPQQFLQLHGMTSIYPKLSAGPAGEEVPNAGSPQEGRASEE